MKQPNYKRGVVFILKKIQGIQYVEKSFLAFLLYDHTGKESLFINLRISQFKK